MLGWLKLSHHRHSGQLRPHEHTSYLPLFLLLVGVGFTLTTFTVSAASPGPEAGSVGISGSMPGKPPTTAAVILTPTTGERFGTSPITVTGTCPPDTLVEIFKNDIFAGSTPCSATGTFSLDIDLLIGENRLIARVYDALNQPGPDSEAVIIFYDGVPFGGSALTPLDFGGPQLLLNTDAVFRGSFPGQDMTVPIEIIGGLPPYAVNVQWGDGDNSVVPRPDNAAFSQNHAYAKPGNYQITLQATDASGRVAFLSVAAIINGQPAVAAADTEKSPTNQLLVLWPLYTSALAIVVSFWLGEQREKRILRRQAGALTGPIGSTPPPPSA